MNMFYFWLGIYLWVGHFLALSKTDSSRSDDDNAYLLKNEAPDPGPEMDTVYIPGNAGAPWTKEEIDSTRSGAYLFYVDSQKGGSQMWCRKGVKNPKSCLRRKSMVPDT